MSKFETGDMVVLASGSMRMTVESVEDETVSVVWCHEGRIGRDSFAEKLLNKWEVREDFRPAPRPAYNPASSDERAPRPYGGGEDRPRPARDDDRPRPARDDDRPRPSYGAPRSDDRGGYKGGGGGYKGNAGGGFKGAGGGYKGGGDDRGPRPAPGGKTGWDGRPREKKFYRKDD